MRNRDEEGLTEEERLRESRRDRSEDFAAENLRDDIAREPVPEQEIAGAPRTGDELFPEEIRSRHQKRWESIQTSFVDDPRRAVEDAEGLVAELTEQIQESFARQRERLEAAWTKGAEASTEDLRRALQQYRAYFTRLLTM